MMMMMMMMMMIVTDNNVTGGYWLIGDPATNARYVATVAPANGLWPHNMKVWEWYSGRGWQSDPLLTVTGNMNIDILQPYTGCLKKNWD